MIHRVVGEQFIQSSPELATIVRATLQFAGKLLALERCHEFREHEYLVKFDAEGECDRANSKSTSDSGLVVTVQGGYWLDIVRWTEMQPPTTHPRYTCLCDDELVIAGLQPDDGTVLRETPFVLSPC